MYISPQKSLCKKYHTSLYSQLYPAMSETVQSGNISDETGRSLYTSSCKLFQPSKETAVRDQIISE